MNPIDEPLGLQPGQCLPHGHPADSEHLHEVPLAGQSVSRAHLGPDPLGELRADLVVLGSRVGLGRHQPFTAPIDRPLTRYRWAATANTIGTSADNRVAAET